MFCGISGTVPEDPVVSKKSGLLFERRLIEKLIQEQGKDPVTGDDLSLDDLLPVKTNKAAKPRVAPAASIPGLLGLFHNEWDALMLENNQLRQQLTLTRQELAHALYAQDAAQRVIARERREKEEAQQALATAQAGRGAKRAAEEEEEGAGKRAKAEVIPSEVLEGFLAKSQELSSRRKKYKVPATHATAEAIQGYGALANIALHKTTKGGINSLDAAGELVASAGDDTTVQIYDLANSKKLGPLSGHSSRVSSVRFLGPSTVVSGSADGTVRLWSQEAEGGAFKALAALGDNGGDVVAALPHPAGGHVVAVSGGDRRWRIWDVARGAAVAVVEEASLGSAQYTSADLHPDGLLVACGTDDAAVRMFDLRAQGAEAARFHEGHRGSISSISFSENGYLMASAGEDGARVWDLRKLKCVKAFETDGPALLARFDTAGGFLAVGSAGKLSLLAARQDYAVVREFSDLGKKGAGRAVAFGADASYVAIGSADHALRVYRGQ